MAKKTTTPQPTEKQILEILLDHIGVYQAASHLENARKLWRAYPEIVEAPQWPASLAAMYAEFLGYVPNDRPHNDEDYAWGIFKPGGLEAKYAQAKRIATKRLKEHAAKAAEEAVSA